MTNWRKIGLTAVVLALGGCKTEHTIHTDSVIEVKPITVNINIRVEKQLENFFDFEKDAVAASAPANKEGAIK